MTRDHRRDHHLSNFAGAQRKEALGLSPALSLGSSVHSIPHQAQGPPRGGLPSAAPGPPTGLLRLPAVGQTLPLSSPTSFLLLISILNFFSLHFEIIIDSEVAKKPIVELWPSLPQS